MRCNKTHSSNNNNNNNKNHEETKGNVGKKPKTRTVTRKKSKQTVVKNITMSDR